MFTSFVPAGIYSPASGGKTSSLLHLYQKHNNKTVIKSHICVIKSYMLIIKHYILDITIFVLQAMCPQVFIPQPPAAKIQFVAHFSTIW